ncbi:MAG: HAD-IC family P-type ATPase [Anaeromyxobacteraceae bacterium]
MEARFESPAPPPAWHALPAGEVLARLGSSEAGLSDEEAARRLARHGPNVLARAEGPGALRVLVRQLASSIIHLLLGAGVVAILLGKALDGAVVLGAVLVNALIGFLQEYRAGKAVAALSRMVPEAATVLRGGHRTGVAAAALVPGDVVALAPGDRVPADARVLHARQLHAQEAALTGESVPVAKHAGPSPAAAAPGDRHGMVFGGTHVTAGTGLAVVVATGRGTELGRISALLEAVTALETPLTRALATVGGWLTGGVLGLGAVLLAIALLRGYALADGLMVAITIAVAAVPEGLPAVITIALAVGVQRMARRHAVVRHLPSVETLGATTVICSDKTGTLTRNELTVQEVWVPEGAGREALLRAAALCNDAGLVRAGGRLAVTGDPTEGALLVAAEEGGVAVEAVRAAWPRLDTIPFESERRLMATLHRAPDGEAVLLAKGAPEVIVPRAALPPAAATGALARAGALARRGMRVLAVAARRLPPGTAEVVDADAGGGLELLGLVGMLDPPRPAAIAAVAACHEAGIAVKMITGDHVGTAEAIGERLGLCREGDRVVTGAELGAMDDAAFGRAAREANVFARVAPEHKLRLVRALQAGGHVVAMTGDGVNDAPALRQADVGVAMGLAGTAVSREAADVVLADDDFATLSAAVEEGRRIHDNLVKSLAFVLPANLGLGLILAASVLAFPLHEVDGALVPLLPVLPTQLLWVNLVASVTLSVPLAFEVAEHDVMRRPPRPPGAPLLGRFVVRRTLLVASVMAAGAIGLFLWEYAGEVARAGHAVALAEARTMAVTTVVFFQAFYLFDCRSLSGPAWRLGMFSNRAVYAGVGALLLLQAGFVYLPFMQAVFGTRALDLEAVLLSAAAGAVVLPVVGLEKRLRAGPRTLPANPGGGPRRRGPAAISTDSRTVR